MVDQRRKPDNFDWVTARYSATPPGMLDLLRRLAEANVETRNQLLAAPRKFAVGHEDDRLFYVAFQDATWPSQTSATFMRRDRDIEVRIATPGATDVDLVLVPALTDAGDVVCVLDGVELAPWQVLRRALDGMFFPPRR